MPLKELKHRLLTRLNCHLLFYVTLCLIKITLSHQRKELTRCSYVVNIASENQECVLTVKTVSLKIHQRTIATMRKGY